MEVTKQHKLIFFLSHVFGQLPYSLKTANGKYRIFDSRIRLAYTKSLGVIIVSLQVYGIWCAVASHFDYVPDLFSRTVFIFAYSMLTACMVFIFRTIVTKRNVFRFWFYGVNDLQFDDLMQTNPKKSFDKDLVLTIMDLTWLLIMSIYDIFFFQKPDSVRESPPICQMFYFFDFTSLIHFTTLWELKIFCWCFLFFGNVLQKFYEDTNVILQGSKKRFSKRFWLNQLKDLRVKDLQAKELMDFLHSFYIPVILAHIIWGYSSTLITLSARVGIDTIVQCIWAIYAFWNITLILAYCQSLEKEAEKTAQGLHRLFVNCDDLQIKEEVELFSLQVLHKRIEFSALGFFRLDFTLLYSIIGSLTSYIVILSQFQDELNRPKVACKRLD